jgi:undecaprenyl diphosphate synthase
VIGLLYRLYAWRLAREIRRRPVPGHVGIILDGSRRYARERRLADPGLAYGLGAEKLDDVLAWCAELGIPTLSLRVLSTENLLRSPRELSGIFAAIETKLARLAEDRCIRRHAVRVRAVGKLELLPDSTLGAIRAAEAATADQRGMTLLIAVAYGGREEIAGDRALPLRARRARPGPHHPHQRRDPPLGVHALAERLQRVLLLRRPLARVPQGGLPQSRARLSAAPAPLRALTPPHALGSRAISVLSRETAGALRSAKK